MSEEEKKAIELLSKKNTEYYYRYVDVREAVSIVLNLIKKQDKKYYYIALGDVEWSKFNNDVDEDNYDIGNCFKTMEEAEKVVRHLKTRAKLQRIADRLNNGQEIDWNDSRQPKYFIFYVYNLKNIYLDTAYRIKLQGTIYCLDENFKDIAIKEIGEEELKAYLKGE